MCKPGALDECDDGDQCTADSCDGGCAHEATNPCDDANPCTDDACQPTACVNSPNTAPCDDGSVCSQVDLCSGSQCTGGSFILCDDGQPCTDNLCDSQTRCSDQCDPIAGCVFPPSSVGCSDDDPCTVGDTCGGGECNPGTPQCQLQGCVIGFCLPLGDIPICTCLD